MITKYKDFLLENKSDNIDFDKIDLQKEFDYLNKLMFSNKITPVKLKWFKSKTKIGLMTHTGDKVDSISISTFYKINKKTVLEVLAHEMIHAYMVQQHIFEKDDHGNKFKKMLNDLNEKHPQYNIKPTEDASQFTVNSNKEKITGSILFKHDEEYSVIFVSGDIINDNENLEKFVDDLKSYIKRVPMNVFVRDKSVDIEFYKCTSTELLGFKIKRKLSLSSLEFFKVNEKTIDIIKDGEKIKTVKLK